MQLYKLAAARLYFAFNFGLKALRVLKLCYRLSCATPRGYFQDKAWAINIFDGRTQMTRSKRTQQVTATTAQAQQ